MYSAYAIKENASTHYTSYASWIRPIILGRTSVPEVFFNSELIGGLDDLAALEDSGRLDGLIKACLEGPPVSPDFPPQLRKPATEEFLQVLSHDWSCNKI